MGARTHTPPRSPGAFARFFPGDFGLTRRTNGSARGISLQHNFNRGVFTRLQSFPNVQAPMLARPPDCAYRCSSESTGQPGRLHHAMNLGLPPRNCGIATCLNRAIGTAGLSPAGLWPCRPLQVRYTLPTVKVDLVRRLPVEGSMRKDFVMLADIPTN